jgi:hypothetical protein
MGARPAGSGKIRFCKSCHRERPAMLESRSWVGSPPLCWMTLSRGQAGFRSCEDSQAWILNPQAKISQLNNCAVDKAPGHPERNTHISKVRESAYSHLQCRDAWRVRPNPTVSIVVADHYHRVRCDSHWLTLVREQDAAQSHASEKIATTVKNIPPLFRREGLGPRSCLSKSSQSRWSMEDLLYGKCPPENAHKRPAFRFCRLVATFEKLIHKS